MKNSERNRTGYKEIKQELNRLRPEELAEEITRYRKMIVDFNLDYLLKIYDIKAKLILAANVLDMPEKLTHELALAEKNGLGVANAINTVGESIANEINHIAFNLTDIPDAILDLNPSPDKADE